MTIQFLAEWAFRSSILILSGGLLLWVLRVKDPSIRLAAWTAMLFASLTIPALTALLPEVPFVVTRAAIRPALISVGPEPVHKDDNVVASSQTASGADSAAARFDWKPATVMTYGLVVLALLLRICVGLALSLRLLRGSRPTDRAIDGIQVLESDEVSAPLTLGVARPAIVLPGDWREWNGAKLEAVLAHERSHVRRHDPIVQVLSMIHRALLWFSPLSWFLHMRIVRDAEEASDDAAVSATGDRTFYAEVLLEFVQRGMRRGGWRSADWMGVSMSGMAARYGRADKRIHRILDGTGLSRGVTRWSVAAILAVASPVAYVVAAAHPESSVPRETAVPRESSVPQRQADSNPAATETPAAIETLPVKPVDQTAVPQKPVQPAAQTAPGTRTEPVPFYLNGLGSVIASTVTIKSRIEGQLMSVSFKEGDLVQAGQLLASIDPRPLQIQLAQAEGQLDQDRGFPAVNLVAGKLKADQANVDNAQLQLSYAQIRAPISGVAGLLQVDPGNIVRPTDERGILVITQLQPIAVLFTIPEDTLPTVRARLREGRPMPVEAWNRNMTVQVATGRLIAVDNQIDVATGTVRLKAVFDNKDDGLFPNQFVNVRLAMGGR